MGGLNAVKERRPNELVKCISAESMEKLEKAVNEFIEEVGWVRELRPVAYAERQEYDEEHEIWNYTTYFGMVIRYEPSYTENAYVPPKCKLCGATEEDRKGQWITGDFYCIECLKKKLK